MGILRTIVGLFLGVALMVHWNAQAETVNCKVITPVMIPYTINTQGVYCLQSKIGVNMASGAAITIAVNNVTLDLNGYALGNLAAGPGTQAVGIEALNRSNVTIKNGTVRGFYDGIDVTGSGNRVVDTWQIRTPILAFGTGRMEV